MNYLRKSKVINISFFASQNKINSIYANYCKKRNISFIWLRIFIYGRYQRKDSIIPSIINNLKKQDDTYKLNKS